MGPLLGKWDIFPDTGQGHPKNLLGAQRVKMVKSHRLICFLAKFMKRPSQLTRFNGNNLNSDIPWTNLFGKIIPRADLRLLCCLQEIQNSDTAITAVYFNTDKQ